MTHFPRFGAAIVSSIMLAACQTHSSDPATAYDFGGVFDDTVAGTIERDRPSRRPDGPPNLVLIIADDLGWPYLGFLGDENVITPNMDVLGNGGTVFERGYVTSNHCSPTLRSLITGLHPVQYEDRANAIADARLAAEPEPDADTPVKQRLLRNQYVTSAIEEFETLPRVLAEAGYASHQSGKWWEQSYAHGGFTDGMTGSWEWREGVELGDRWFFTFMGGEGMDIGRNTMEPVTDFIMDHADQPFFIWYGPALPHTPLNPPYQFYKYFVDRSDLSESAKLYYANIAWFDWGVGQLLDSLEGSGVLDNTLIVYVNDNGWQQPSNVEYADDAVNFANGGPRGKGSFFETAFRTPIIFYWADEIAAARDTATIASAVDIVPTLLDYAGVELPTDLPGHSLRPVIEGGPSPDLRPHVIARLTQHRAGTDFRGAPDPSVEDHMGGSLNGYVRTDQQWHFVWLPESDETALYDLNADPGQLTDVSEAHPDLLAAFKADIRDWRARFETASSADAAL